MQQYFVPADNWNDRYVQITGEDIHHISRVMRLSEGAHIICVHPDGLKADCVIDEISEETVQLHVDEFLHNQTELPISVTIAQGLPKGDKFDLIIQKGTELGATGFIPFKADRSIVVWDKKKQQKKQMRFQKIAKEASEQCHRNHVPEIKPMMDLKTLITVSKEYDFLLFAYEEEAKKSTYQSFATILKRIDPGASVLICIGPEGGFSEKEAVQLKEQQFIPVRLGARILRTETASLYALASISYQFEELGW